MLPYHLDAAKQLAGTLAVRHVADMERRVSALVEERGRVAAGLADLGVAGVEAFPSGANFILVRFHRHDAHESGNACSMRASSSATAAAGRGSTVACA